VPHETGDTAVASIDESYLAWQVEGAELGMKRWKEEEERLSP
jgi:hypothetical protein